MQLQSAQWTQHRFCVCSNLFLEILLRSLVRNPQSSTRVDITDVVPLFAQCGDQIGHVLERLLKGTHIGDLRANVNAYTSDLQIGTLPGLRVEHPGLGNRYAELVLMQAGRNVRMSFRRDVGIYPYCNRASLLESCRRGCAPTR